MSEQDTDTQTNTDAAPVEYSGRQIMCFVSKKMVPIEDTVEVEYAKGQTFQVLRRYVRYANKAN
jgi:uncharacterized protein YxjI